MSWRRSSGPRSLLGNATLSHFFKRVDFGVPDFSPHGTQGTAATLLREHGFGCEVVALWWAHAARDKITAAHHPHELAEERRPALPYLADQIDRLAAWMPANVEAPTRTRRSIATV